MAWAWLEITEGNEANEGQQPRLQKPGGQTGIDPSSGTRPAKGHACNRSARARLAAAGTFDARSKRGLARDDRAGFQPAGSWGILPQDSGMPRQTNTNARLEAAATGRQDACPTTHGQVDDIS